MDVRRHLDPDRYFDDVISDDDEVFDDVKVLKRRMEVVQKILLDVHETVWSIAVTKRQTAWIGIGDSPLSDDIICSCHLYEVCSTGEVTNKIDINFWPYHIAITNEEDVLVSSGWTSSVIRRVNRHGISDFAKLAPYWVYGLMVDSDNQVLVCLHSKNQCRGRVVLLSPAGDKLRDIKTDHNGQWVFSHPFSMTMSSKGVIMFKDGKKLICLDPSRLNFSSRRPMEGCWNVKNFLCDRFGYMVGGSVGTVHIINTVGEWLHSFCEDFMREVTIYGLAVDADDNLWMGTGDGRIFVVKYLE